MGFPKVSIIILNWNGVADTEECLESLKRISYPNYEVIIVDNASSGNDVGILTERYGKYATIIANPKNDGFPEGNNVGIRHALSRDCDYCLLLNNDTIVHPEFLTELVKHTDDKAIGIAGSKIYNYFEPKRIDSAGGEAWYWLMQLRNKGPEEDIGQFEEIADRDFIFANSMLIRREVLEKVGLLDPYFFYGIEEYDFCLRVKRSGYRIIYVPTSIIWHKSGRSRRKMEEHPETARLVKDRMGTLSYKFIYRLSRKHYGIPMFVVPFTAYYIGMAIPLLLGGSPTTALRRIIHLRDVRPVLREIKKVWHTRLKALKR